MPKFHLGAGGEEDGARGAGEGGQRVQAFGEFDVGLVGQHLDAGVGEALHLFARRRHDSRVAMAGVQHRDAAGEIDVAGALDVPHLGVQRALGVGVGGVAEGPRHGRVAAGEQVGVCGHGRASSRVIAPLCAASWAAKTPRHAASASEPISVEVAGGFRLRVLVLLS